MLSKMEKRKKKNSVFDEADSFDLIYATDLKATADIEGAARIFIDILMRMLREGNGILFPEET